MKSFSVSLTVRIFLTTGALLITVCAITYGMIAYLTPITYTAILEDERRQQGEALIQELGKIAPEETSAFMASYVGNTGADITIVDELGNVLYGVMPVEDDTADATESAAANQIVVTDSDILYGAMDEAAPSAIGAPEIDNAVTVVQDGGAQAHGDVFYFIYADGTAATLTLYGGTRAVNQAAEALGRALPFLIGVVAIISLAGSFFYARFITRPIVSLSQIAGRMAKLDFDARWDKRRGDEIGALGRSLNLLSGNLSRALDELEDANRALRRDIDRERELDRQRMAFFSAASHELKTPITILKGQLSGMLAQVGVYSDREKYLARALEVAGRMEGLVREILTINRIGSAGYAISAKTVDLSELMARQLALDEELAAQKELVIETDIAPGTLVEGDEALLAKALDNVLINAILYSPPGATIAVEVRERAFSVENTGAAIPEEALSQLFTPFYRVERSRNRKSGGSGLGLYLVKSILDLHNASCGVENTARGVRFSARFH